MSRLILPKRYFQTGKPVNQLSEEANALYVEFDNYQRKYYHILPVECICGEDNSYLISSTDRTGYEFPLVLCRSCGLIRAKEYWDQESTIDYYKNWYRKLHSGHGHEELNRIFREQIQKSKKFTISLKSS